MKTRIAALLIVLSGLCGCGRKEKPAVSASADAKPFHFHYRANPTPIPDAIRRYTDFTLNIRKKNHEHDLVFPASSVQPTKDGSVQADFDVPLEQPASGEEYVIVVSYRLDGRLVQEAPETTILKDPSGWPRPASASATPPAVAAEPGLFELRVATDSPSPSAKPYSLLGGDDESENLFLEPEVLLDASAIQSAAVLKEGGGSPRIRIQFTEDGARRLSEVTGQHAGRRIGIVLAGSLRIAPLVTEAITGGSLEMSGRFNEQEAANIVAKLNASSQRSSLPSPPSSSTMPAGLSTLSAEDAIRIANEAAQKKGYDLEKFENPKAKYDTDQNPPEWSISYQGKLRAPGNFFYVFVDDKTGNADVHPGE